MDGRFDLRGHHPTQRAVRGVYAVVGPFFLSGASKCPAQPLALGLSGSQEPYRGRYHPRRHVLAIKAHDVLAQDFDVAHDDGFVDIG